VGPEVFVADEQTELPVDTMRWLRLARSVLEAEGVRSEAELSVLFVDEGSMAELNRRFQGIDGPTDVLAFPMDDEPLEGGRNPDSGGSGPGWAPAERAGLPTLIGDVVICPAVAARNATARSEPLEDELALLVVHGILHLLGTDHEEPAQAEVMEERERGLLERFHRQRGGGPAEGGPATDGTEEGGPATDGPAEGELRAGGPATDGEP